MHACGGQRITWKGVFSLQGGCWNPAQILELILHLCLPYPSFLFQFYVAKIHNVFWEIELCFEISMTCDELIMAQLQSN